VLPWRHLWEGTPRERTGGYLRWMWERLTSERAPTPSADEVSTESPSVVRGAHPEDELRITFVGHATFLIQAGGFNILTDPVFGDRASPFPVGPRRFTPPGLELADLPEIHAVVLSHDHYDHLDDFSVRSLHERFGERLTWCTPLGYRGWFEARGIERLKEARES